MAANVGKRRAITHLDDSVKRQRFMQLPSSPVEASQVAEDEDENSCPGNEESSDGENNADTPITPFSPGRKKFPSELKTIKCTQEGCTKVFNRPARLTVHLRTHNNDRPHVCTFEGCDKAYFESKHLAQHVKGSHTKEREFSCDWEGCNKSFLTSTRLNRHKTTHTGQNLYRCTGYPPCNEPFRKHQTLQRHIRSAHLNLAPYPCTFVDPVTLQACSAAFDGGTGLRQHMDRFHSPARIKCLQCDAPGFKTDRQLQAHIRKEHAHCIFCDIKCASERELLKHIEIYHSGITLEQRKNVPCTFPGCNKRFTKQNNLNTHVRTAHMGERFICGTFDLSSYPDMTDFDDDEGCGKDFVSKLSLMDHVRTAHMGLKAIANASRKKTTQTSIIEDEYEDEGDENEEQPEFDSEEEYIPKTLKPKRNKRTRKTIDDGTAGHDPRRNIACIAPGCRNMFIRQYDLQVHMRDAHPTSFHGMDPAGFNDHFAFSDGLAVPELNSGVEGFGLQGVSQQIGGFDEPADFDWTLQRQALEGGPFWIGADTGYFASRGNGDQGEWEQEEEEMRRLIG
ncbi:C2H2 transcription factor [Diplocarpon rosae]|nr:C2H2 transcription factor [Diplocarpon rosae]